MDSNGNPFFFFFDPFCVYNFFFSENLVKYNPKFLKIKTNKIIKNELDQRINDQINFFLNLLFSEITLVNFYFIFLGESSRWVFPFSKKKKSKVGKNVIKMIKKIFWQEIKISKLYFFEVFKRNFKILDSYFSNLEIIIHISGKIKKKNLKPRVIFFNQKKIWKRNEIIPFNYILIARKLKIKFKVILLDKLDCPFFVNLCEKTAGLYSRPLKNFFEILFTEELLAIFCSNFLSVSFLEEFYVLPFSTKLLDISNKDKNFDHKNRKNYCTVCLSFFSSLFSECLVCGVGLLF